MEWIDDHTRLVGDAVRSEVLDGLAEEDKEKGRIDITENNGKKGRGASMVKRGKLEGACLQ